MADSASHSGAIFSPIFAVVLFLVFTIAYGLISFYPEKNITIILLGCVVAVGLAFLAQMLGVPEFSREAIPEFPLTPFSFESIFGHWINFEVIGVVFGMSILVEASRETGLFDYLAIRVIKYSKGTPIRLWLLVFFLTLFLSAILDNVTAILLVGSMTLLVCRALLLDPKPYLITEAFACVAAGVTTLVSSLPSIIIGTEARIDFVTFSFVSLPYMLIAIPLSLFYLRMVFRQELQPLDEGVGLDLQRISFLDEWSVLSDRRVFGVAVLVIAGTVVGFVGANLIGSALHVEIPLAFVAITGGALSLLLLTSTPLKVLKELHWDTLIFFIGLFVLVGSLEQAGVLNFLAQLIATPGTILPISIPLVGDRSFNLLTIGIIIFAVSILSAFLANIPLTAAMAPVAHSLIDVGGFASGGILWFSILFAATFGGGFTPLGSAPSVIVMGTMREEGQPISFVRFVKIMAPLSIILLIIGAFYLVGLFYLLETFTVPI